MTTNESEVTAPTTLCGPDGKHLNPAARGWSRFPTLTCKLGGSWGRNKRWDYWAILAGDWVFAVTFADVDYLGIVSVWWADISTGRTGGSDNNIPLARRVGLPDLPGTAPLHWSNPTTSVSITDDSAGTTIAAHWVEADGRSASLEARVDLPAGHQSLNVVIPWSAKRFQFTSKHQARPVHASFKVGDEEHCFGASAERSISGDRPEVDHSEAWGVLDVGRGRWRYSNRWNWAGGAGLALDTGSVVGLQFGGKWTEGTGFTENGLIIDGVLNKIGAELEWTYNWDRPLDPWTVRGADGAVDLVLAPKYDRHSKVNAGVLAMEVHQVFGCWTGTVRSDDGVSHRVEGIQGFAEEARNRW